MTLILVVVNNFIKNRVTAKSIFDQHNLARTSSTSGYRERKCAENYNK